MHRLIDRLNSVFSLDLCIDPRTEREKKELEGRAIDRCHRAIMAVVGGSNARELAAALEDSGVPVHDCTVPGWRISKANVDDVVAKLRACSPKPDIILCQCLDNNVYYGMDEDGCTYLPRKIGGLYHVEGQLQVASREQVEVLMRTFSGVTDAFPSSEVIFITGTPRYAHVALPCCEDDMHVTNRGTGLMAEVKKELERVREQVKRLLAKSKAKLIDPTKIIDFTDRTVYRDQCHLSAGSVLLLRDKVRELVAGKDRQDLQHGNQAVRTRTLSAPCDPKRGGWGASGGGGRGSSGGWRGKSHFGGKARGGGWRGTSSYKPY